MTEKAYPDTVPEIVKRSLDERKPGYRNGIYRSCTEYMLLRTYYYCANNSVGCTKEKRSEAIFDLLKNGFALLAAFRPDAA